MSRSQYYVHHKIAIKFAYSRMVDLFLVYLTTVSVVQTVQHNKCKSDRVNFTDVLFMLKQEEMSAYECM